MKLNFNELLLIINILFIGAYIFYLFKIKAFTMNAKPLTHQPLFKAAIVIPIVTFFLLGIITWSGHTIQIDSEGFENFLNISKLPLAALSVSIPLGVIVNNIHRTIQTDKQIEEAERKNTLDRYYAHRKNTIEILQNLDMNYLILFDNEVDLKFQNCYKTYKKFYPDLSPESNDYTPSTEFILGSFALWRKLADLVKITEFSSKHSYFSHLILIEKNLQDIHTHYRLQKLGASQLYSKTFLNEDGISYDFRTMISSEHNLKMNIAAYWLANIAIMGLLEVTLSLEFMNDTADLIDYSLSTEVRYEEWATLNLIKGYIPKVIMSVGE